VSFRRKLAGIEPLGSKLNMTRWIASCLVALMAGCNSTSNSTSGDDGEPHITRLAAQYFLYMNAHQGTAPPSEEAFKQFVAERAEAASASAGANTVDALFVSPRDHQPYVVLYGADVGPEGVVAYERSGVDGRRFVAYRAGFAREVDQAELRKIVPAAK
jgi:hypothetical protein